MLPYVCAVSRVGDAERMNPELEIDPVDRAAAHLSHIVFEQLVYWRKAGLAPREMMRALGRRANGGPVSEEDVREALALAYIRLTSPNRSGT